ncbi:MAG TPA: ABC transporter substrate-binding protein [Methylomirabilota bacterium]|nr:ABC transporter substrate-binding protein [Methylomirabilota bacterium]
MEPHPTAGLSRRKLLKLGGAAAVASTLSLRHDETAADPESLGSERQKFEAAKHGGTFRVRLDQPPAHFDPHQTVAHSTMVPLSFAYSRLVKVQAGSNVTPGTQPIEGDLADSWDSKGEVVYIFKLRKGVQWHPKAPVNGRELTAEDVKYTYDRFLTMKGNGNRSVLDMVDKVEAPDKYTVKFTLKEPNVWFVDRLASTSTWIIAKECVEKYGDLKKPESVVGTGPWMLERYDSPSRVSFGRNRNYFLPGLPYADAVELTIDPDPASAFAAFLAGKYDFGPEYGMVVRRNDVGVAKKGIRWLPTREYLMVSGSLAAMKLDQDPFKDVRVRRALAMADNWREVLGSNTSAQGKGAPDPLVPAALKEWAVPIDTLPAEGRKLYEPDPVAARQLLTEAGYSGGIKIPVETTAGYGPNWMAGVQVAVKNWKAAGIEVDLKLKEYDAFVSSALSGSFDKTLLTLRGGATDPDFYLTPLLPGEPLNASGVNDPKLTEMIKLQRRTANEKKRREIVFDIQRYCSQQVYYACGASGSVVSAWMPNVKEFGPNIGPDYGGRLMAVWLEK